MQNIVIRKAVLFGVLFLFGYSVFSQQGIGTNNPETSSVLEIKSNSLGVLIPRLTNSQMETIESPADGLMVYCLDCPSLGIYTFNSSTSQFLLNGPKNELEATVPGISTVSSTITKYGKISTAVKITDTQGLEVTQKGIVYSFTNTSPILSNSTSVINDNALVNGVFSSETNVLSPTTTYYIRSFATNIHGTSYGEVSTHTTPSAFVYTIVPTNQQYRLPLSQDAIGNDYLIDWGDGSESYMIPGMSQADRNNAILHTYSSTSTVTIMVYGDLGKIIETTVNSARMIRDISNWGSATVGTRSFQNCQNLSISATNLPNLDANLAYTFSGATSFNSDISNWDTSNVTNMEGIFFGATAFNQDISQKTVTGDGASYTAWGTSSVTTMLNMFSGATSFNSDISNWDTSNVTNMEGIFFGATAFNQDISQKTVTGDGASYTAWDTSSVTTMRNMFSGADAFNQPIGTWDVSSVTDMYGLFYSANSFNQNLSNWNTIKVIDMGGMFESANSFNQNLSNWNTINVINMVSMFAANLVFNNNGAPLTFNTSSVTNMQSMFYGTSTFNQDISQQEVTVNGVTYTAWDTSNVTNMRTMFWLATAFNQNIGNWNTPSVTTMHRMFANTSNFNQDISSWNTSSVTNVKNGIAVEGMVHMFDGATAFNQDLSGWCVSLIPSVPNNFATGATAWTLPNSRPVWGTCP